MSAKPIFTQVHGAPHQPGDVVRVVQTIDASIKDLRHLVGRIGKVRYLEYSCGCGQTYPEDPMFGVLFEDGVEEEFWKEELESWRDEQEDATSSGLE